MKRKLFVLLIIATTIFDLTFASVPKAVNNATKAMVTVITYGENDKMIGTASGFFVGEKSEIISEYEIFRYARRAEVIDMSGKKYAVQRICGANELYDVVKFTISESPKESLKVSQTPAAEGMQTYLIATLNSKKPQILESKISEEKSISGGTYYTLSTDYKPQYVSAPIINEKGEVVGVIQRNAKRNETKTYAISADLCAAMSVKALWYADAALSSINIPKQLPANEKDATTYIYMMSQIKMDSTIHATALQDFTTAYPSNADGYVEQAKFYSSKDQIDMCETSIKRAIELSATKDNPHYVFSRLIYQKSLTGDSVAKAKGWNLERALSEADAAYSANPMPLYVLQQGDCYYGMKQYDKALEKYNQVNLSSLASAETFFYAANAKQKLNAPAEESIALLDSALSRLEKPYTRVAAPYLFERANLYNSSGKYREAVLDYIEYEHVVGFAQLNDNFYYIREQAAVQGTMYQQAVDDINRAVAIKPNDYVYNAERAALMARLGQTDESISSAKKAISIDPNASDGYRILGIVYGETKQKKLCLENLEKAKSLGDEHAQELLDQYKK